MKLRLHFLLTSLGAVIRTLLILLLLVAILLPTG